MATPSEYPQQVFRLHLTPQTTPTGDARSATGPVGPPVPARHTYPMALLTYSKLQRDPIERFIEATEATDGKRANASATIPKNIPISEHEIMSKKRNR